MKIIKYLKVMKSTGLLVLLACLLSVAPIISTAQSNKVVVVPLGGGDSLTDEQATILEFFQYDAANDRLEVQGTVGNPINEFWFRGMNVRGASQVRQDFRTNAPDIPGSAALVEIEEETISLGNTPNNTQAVVVHAFANLDTQNGVSCPCEFRGYIIQDDGLPGEVISLPSHLELEAGDNDIDATISHTFAFIATAQTQNYSFQVQLFAQQGQPPIDGVYEVDEAGITISTYGLAGAGTLILPPNNISGMSRKPESESKESKESE